MRIADAVFWNSITIVVAPMRPRPTQNMPATPPVLKATSRAGPILPVRAAAAVRTLPRTARPMPMKPVRPDMKQPARNARVRNRPDSKNERASVPSGLSTATEVTKTTIASGTRMNPIVRNWRFR